jgi:hypothetical protein
MGLVGWGPEYSWKALQAECRVVDWLERVLLKVRRGNNRRNILIAVVNFD